VFGIDQGERGSSVFSEKFSWVNQQAVTDLLGMKKMVVTITDKIEMSRTGQLTGECGIVMAGDAQRGQTDGSMMTPMVMQVAKDCAAACSDQMLVADIVAVNKMNRALKSVQIGQHEGRNQIPAVQQQFRPMLIGHLNSPVQVGNVIMTVGENGNAHAE